MHHLNDNLIGRYLAEDCSSEETLHVDAHVADCETCLARVRKRERSLARFGKVLASWSLARHQALLEESDRRFAESSRPPRQPFSNFWRRYLAESLTPIQLAGVAVTFVLVLVVVLSLRSSVERSSPSITLTDSSGPVSASANGAVTLPHGLALPAAWRVKIGELLANGLVVPSSTVQTALVALETKTARLGEAEGPSITLLQPVATMVRLRGPSFRWTGLTNALNYRFVLGRDGALISEGTVGAKTELDLPVNVPPLVSGADYAWHVESTVGGELVLSDPGRFRVLDTVSLAEVERLERQFAGSALALLAVYEAYGLRSEAIAQAERLRLLNPTNSTVLKIVTQLNSSASASAPNP